MIKYFLNEKLDVLVGVKDGQILEFIRCEQCEEISIIGVPQPVPSGGGVTKIPIPSVPVPSSIKVPVKKMKSKEDLSDEEKKEKKKQYMREWFAKNKAKKNVEIKEDDEDSFWEKSAIKKLIQEYGQSDLSRIKLANEIGENVHIISTKVGLDVKYVEQIIRIFEDNI